MHAFHLFRKFDRQGCLSECFQGDESALADAEMQARELIGHWIPWLLAQSHELPSVLRLDVLAHRSAPGQATIATMELTELGGCHCGWEEGPEVIFAAMLRSCLRPLA
mmetsp:Transcript_40491/g.128127  ORF Transcript_40491/g.128127 Transcript_40491/m.128127 type:complete len:108 (-) Transcript_40491:56-379(-)